MVHLTGFHGTSLDNGRHILDERNFMVSGSFRDWLGKGVYFFENDKHQAYMFAKFKNRKYKVLTHSEICVLQVDIHTDNYIDLLIDDDRMFLKRFAEKLQSCVEKKKQEIGDWEHKEGFILDMLFKIKPYDLVKAAYIVPKRKKNMMFGYEDVHIQICVKDTKVIDYSSLCEVICNDYE